MSGLGQARRSKPRRTLGDWIAIRICSLSVREMSAGSVRLPVIGLATRSSRSVRRCRAASDRGDDERL